VRSGIRPPSSNKDSSVEDPPLIATIDNLWNLAQESKFIINIPNN
jgi:hypothetical protein